MVPATKFGEPGQLRHPILPKFGGWHHFSRRDWLSSFGMGLGGMALADMLGRTAAAGGVLGTSRGQWHLRQMMVSCNGYGVNSPQVYIGGAAQKFDATGRFTDEAGRVLIGQLIEALVKLGTKLKS